MANLLQVQGWLDGLVRDEQHGEKARSALTWLVLRQTQLPCTESIESYRQTHFQNGDPWQGVKRVCFYLTGCRIQNHAHIWADEYAYRLNVYLDLGGKMVEDGVANELSQALAATGLSDDKCPELRRLINRLKE